MTYLGLASVVVVLPAAPLDPRRLRLGLNALHDARRYRLILKQLTVHKKGEILVSMV